MRRRGLIASAVVAAGLGLMAPAAFAHAQLEGTSPQRGATVKSQPDAVTFRFDEPVEGTFGAVRVFDSRGQRVDEGAAFHPGGSGPLMAVHLKPHLPEGSYTATYRVVSADGHLVSSGFVFSIGRAGPAGKTVAELIGDSGPGAPTDIAFGLARGLQYAALAIVIGGVGFLLLMWIPALGLAGGAGRRWLEASEAFARRARKLLIGAAAVGAVTAAAGVVLEGAVAAGVSGWSALSSSIVRDTLSTRFGTTWGLGVLAWLLAEAALVVAFRRSPGLRRAELGATGVAAPRRALPSVEAGLLLVPFLFLLLVPVFAGHADTQSPRALLLPSVFAHVLAMSLWSGGLVMLVAVLPSATRRLEPKDRSSLLAAVLGRFSPLALGCVIAILASGLVQSLVLVRSPAHLLDTAYGRCVLIKMLLLATLIGIGAHNRRRSVPAFARLAHEGGAPGHAGLVLRRALRLEVALIAVVLGVTAALASYAPSIAAQTGPVNRTATVGPAHLELTVDPARVGSNQIHLYLTNPRDGAQFTGAKEVDVAESLPHKAIGPLNHAANRAGPGHYVVPGAVLGVAGDWRLRITVRVSKFDEYDTTVEVPVR